jgi:hypothetical protein
MNMDDHREEQAGEVEEDEWANPATWSDTRLWAETTAEQRERWLFAAVAAGKIRFVRRLLHMGMSAHSRYQGYTLLHIALHMNETSAVQALCEYGADPYAIGHDWTPVQIALSHTLGNISIASMILRYSGLRYAQEMLQDLEHGREGEASDGRRDSGADERMSDERCLFKALPWIRETSYRYRIIRIGSRTRSMTSVDESMLPIRGGGGGDLDHTFAERILEELQYWYQISARRREHLQSLRSLPHHQTAGSPPIWWDGNSETTMEEETTMGAPRMSCVPALRGPGNEETEEGTNQARITAIWTLPTSGMKYGSLTLSVTHPEIQTIPQQGTIEYMKVWDQDGVQSIATRPDTRLICHPMLYDRAGGVSASYHGWGSVTTPLTPPPWYTLTWLQTRQRLIITAASRSYRMGVMERFSICCCHTEECRCPLQELLLDSLEEGEIRRDYGDVRIRETFNIIITSVENKLSSHREMARGMRALLSHPARRENRGRHHFLAVYGTITELERLNKGLAKCNRDHTTLSMVHMSWEVSDNMLGPPLQAPQDIQEEVDERTIYLVERKFIGLHTGRHIRSQLLPGHMIMASMNPDTRNAIQYFNGDRGTLAQRCTFQLGLCPMHLGKCKHRCAEVETTECQEWIWRQAEADGDSTATLQNRDWLGRPTGTLQRGCSDTTALHFSHTAVWSQLSEGPHHEHLLAQITGAQVNAMNFASSKTHNTSGAGTATRISQRRTPYPAAKIRRVTTCSIRRTAGGHSKNPQCTDLLCMAGTGIDNELFAKYFQQLDVRNQCQIDDNMYHGKECSREKWHMDLHYISKQLYRLTRQIREKADGQCIQCGSKGSRRRLRPVHHGPHLWRSSVRYEKCVTCDEILCSPACLFIHLQECGTSWSEVPEQERILWEKSLWHINETMSIYMMGHRVDRISWYRALMIPSDISRSYVEEAVD